ncbi:MAG: arginine--tRNA ligase [Chloroflexi bacterium]|nr:arginine--tRNA ligase [Chloroflexota bacterium]
MSDAGQSIRSEMRELIAGAIARAMGSGALPTIGDDDRPEIEVSHAANPEHGDVTTNLALRLARPLRRSPIDIATAIADELGEIGPHVSDDRLASVEVAPPGFINMRLGDGYLERSLDAARALGASYGQLAAHRVRHIDIEFVSANPTGPLTVGNARGAFVGDLLSRLLEAAGNEVTREYYFNDTNRQVSLLGSSIAARRAGKPVPEDGYHGAYVADLANEMPEEVWEAASREDEERDTSLGRWAATRIRAGIEASLRELGVRFDVWKTEGSLYAEGWVERAIQRLRSGGHLFEQDGALWFCSTAFGDDKDRVVIRANGTPTYFAADIGYVAEKFSRGFDELIYVWGADHHGTVARNRNAAEAMGFDREAVQMLLYAWVHFVRDGADASMSKRAGEFISLDELLAEVGTDAARWYFASRATTTGIDFDIEAAKDQSAANPVHYVRYAHARISSILRKASEAGLSPHSSVAGTLAGDDISKRLCLAVLRLPEVVEDAASARETHGVTSYATELATTFHAYYRDRRVLDAADRETSARRLALVDATRQTIANTLGLLGISAPQSM